MGFGVLSAYNPHSGKNLIKMRQSRIPCGIKKMGVKVLPRKNSTIMLKKFLTYGNFRYIYVAHKRGYLCI